MLKTKGPVKLTTHTHNSYLWGKLMCSVKTLLPSVSQLFPVACKDSQKREYSEGRLDDLP